MADRLVALGAEVRAADPHVVQEHTDRKVVRVRCTAEEVSAADVVVLLTDHDAFDFELVAEHARHMLDTRQRLTRPANIEFL